MDQKNILGAMLICDYKVSTALEAIKAMSDQVDSIYVNIETLNEWLYQGIIAYLAQLGKPYFIDMWYNYSTWMPKRRYDQHQVRLLPIVTGRNMAIDCAILIKATHLLFVDSDVIIHPGGVEKLLSINQSLVGGYVPGRGVHNGYYYVFSKYRPMESKGPLIYCDYGTCGYMLIARKVFTKQRFRWGSDRHKDEIFHSEDPAFALDWYDLSGERFVVHTQATAYHRDGNHVLTDKEVARDDWDHILRWTDLSTTE